MLNLFSIVPVPVQVALLTNKWSEFVSAGCGKAEGLPANTQSLTDKCYELTWVELTWRNQQSMLTQIFGIIGAPL